jgi:hypothetical protein
MLVEDIILVNKFKRIAEMCIYCLIFLACSVNCEHERINDIDCDTKELDALVHELIIELNGEKFELQGSIKCVTVEAEFSDGTFIRIGIRTLGACTPQRDGSFLIEVTRPYIRYVVKHELRHACGWKDDGTN